MPVGDTPQPTNDRPEALLSSGVGVDNLPACLFLLQRKVECGPFIQFRFGPDAAAVSLDDSTYGRQPHSCAFKLLLAVEALKRAK